MAGDGGNGCVSFRREKFVAKGGPDGGGAGRGGHVIMRASQEEDSLIGVYYSPHRRAQPGGHGKGKKLHGRNGKDSIVELPLGTEVWDSETGQLLGELLADGQELVVACGGKGGLGNCHWKTSTHQTPREHTDGVPGEEKTYKLELKLVADIGLVGYPNAGKSSLLCAISDAHPKVAAYPFTTLNPIIGTIMFPDYTKLTVADIPGLIDGAHSGTGLGHTFLRHVERSRFILYVIDMAAVDGRDPVKDYENLCEELRLYKYDIAERPSLVVANKIDLPDCLENISRFREKTGIDPIPVSAVERHGTDSLAEALRQRCRAMIEERIKNAFRKTY